MSCQDSGFATKDHSESHTFYTFNFGFKDL